MARTKTAVKKWDVMCASLEKETTDPFCKIHKKSGRTAPVKKTINSRYRNLGGFMIDPPETCLKQVESEDGAFWTDLGLCRHCKAPCQRYLTFKKMTPEERKEDSLTRGIIPPRKWGMDE